MHHHHSLRPRRSTAGGEWRKLQNQSMSKIENPSEASPGLLNALLFFILLYQLIDSSVAIDGERGGIAWQILTNQNFASQISLHSHAILMVTVPWSGEARSLMNELAQAMAHKQDKLGSFRLMILYKNSEKTLADAIGATDGISIFFYHDSVPYKYQGRLEVKTVLASAHYFISLLPEELPFKHIKNPENLESFIDSTDSALVVLDFCGWTPKLLAKAMNRSKDAIGLTGSLLRTEFNGETNRTLILKEKKYQEEIEDDSMICAVKEFAASMLEEFISVNKTPDVYPCTPEEFQHFDSFFSKLILTVREFYLPPERHKFGLVSDRSLVSSLGIGDSVAWLAMLYASGCPTCSKILKEEDNLKDTLHNHKSVVLEVSGDENNIPPALPENMPSIILFVDRSSESSEIRGKSKEALDVFKKFVLHSQIISHTIGKDNDMPVKELSVDDVPGSSEYARFGSLLKTQNSRRKEKFSITVVNEDDHVTLENVASDLRGSSLHDVLTYVLQQQKEAKFSSVAKQVGFQLLSDDFDIKIEDIMSSTQNKDPQSNQIPELPFKSHISQADAGNQLSAVAAVSSVEEKPESTDTEDSSQYNLDKQVSSVADAEEMHFNVNHNHANGDFVRVEDMKVKRAGLSAVESPSSDKAAEELPLRTSQYHANDELAVVANVEVEPESLSAGDESSEPHHLPPVFKGSYFFSDGGYRLLKAFTAATNMPSIVIFDPVLQQHYVFPANTVFTNSSLGEFVTRFLNGTLSPYQQCDSSTFITKEGMRSPFVNLDFHEADGIPRVTARTFSELVIGSNLSDSTNTGNGWEKDVLVFFSNNWCGFCQRMEIVVREVYRALKGYMNMLKSAHGNEEFLFRGGTSKEVKFKTPVIYLMDCTLNDCNLIFRMMSQRELYPSIMLFPAQRKEAVPYEGDISVGSIMNFIADHGRDSLLITHKGILWTEAQKGRNNWNIYGKASPAMDEKVILKERSSKRVVKYKNIVSRTSKRLHKPSRRVMVGSILFATDKLLGVQPFEHSRILIVKTDQSTGPQGLIINKHISWDNIDGLGEGSELLKEAPLSLGGPLIKHEMPLLSLSRRYVKDQYPEILQGVYFLEQPETLNEIKRLKSGNSSFADYWFFLGYSSWGWDQLYSEIFEGSWNISNATVGLFEWP